MLQSLFYNNDILISSNVMARVICLHSKYGAEIGKSIQHLYLATQH